MKKLSEYKDEEALDLLAEIMEPALKIVADKKIFEVAKKNKLDAITLALKNHKQPIIRILAALEGVKPEDYHCNILTLPITILEIINDKELVDFFGSQPLEAAGESFGSVMENSEEEK